MPAFIEPCHATTAASVPAGEGWSHEIVAEEYITKSRQPLTEMHVDRLTTPALQKVNETLAKGKAESRLCAGDAILGRPSKANHLLRFLRRLFDWGRRHGHNKTNPAEGVKLAPERKRKRMPEHEAYEAVVKFAQERGAIKAHTRGSLPPYLWPLMELAYLCRMRGIEAVKLTDAHATDIGIKVQRVKGSNSNVVRWTPRLRAAWDAAVVLRATILNRKANRSRPIPFKPQDRYLLITQTGTPLTRAGLDNAFQDLMRAAIDAGVIAEQDRFNLHVSSIEASPTRRATRATRRQRAVTKRTPRSKSMTTKSPRSTLQAPRSFPECFPERAL